MSIERAKEICGWGAPAARNEPYLQAQWEAHGEDFLKWWQRRPEPAGEIDLAQFYEMARTTAGVALGLLDSAVVRPLEPRRLRDTGENADAAFAAAMQVQLGSEVTYFEVDDPLEIASSELGSFRMFGALCWQPEGAGLNVIPFAVQDDREGTFGHTLFDSTEHSDRDSAVVAIHPGLTIVARDGSVITPLEIDAEGICASIMRAGFHMAQLVVGALWSLEARGA
jgi:hypothetical protein